MKEQQPSWITARIPVYYLEATVGGKDVSSDF